VALQKRHYINQKETNMKDFWAKVIYAHDIVKIGDEEYRKFIAWCYTWKGQLFYYLVCLFSPICVLAIIGSIVFWTLFLRILG